MDNIPSHIIHAFYLTMFLVLAATGACLGRWTVKHYLTYSFVVAACYGVLKFLANFPIYRYVNAFVVILW